MLHAELFLSIRIYYIYDGNKVIHFKASFTRYIISGDGFCKAYLLFPVRKIIRGLR